MVTGPTELEALTAAQVLELLQSQLPDVASARGRIEVLQAELEALKAKKVLKKKELDRIMSKLDACAIWQA